MLTKNDVITILRDQQPWLKERFGVKRIAIFGSFAKGTPSKDSDVDMLIEFDRPIGIDFFKVIDFLEEKIGRKVDVLTPGGMQSIRRTTIVESIKRTLIDV